MKEQEDTLIAGMTASNNDFVDLNSLHMDSGDLQPISRKYRVINMTLSMLWAIVLSFVLLLFTSSLFFEFPSEHYVWVYLAYACIFVFFGLLATYHFFADPLIQFALRENDLNLQSGLFFRSLVSQPILRIQHIELKRGPIERKVKLASLQVFSAGGISHTFSIPGLEYEEAIKLRKFILEHRDLASDV